MKDYVQALAADIAPDLVFSHHGDDLHQDHRVVGELCRNAFRDHLILEYEVPKYDGRHGNPNVFVPVEQWALARKLELVISRFPSQSNRYWYTEDTFTALMRLPRRRSPITDRLRRGVLRPEGDDRSLLTCARARRGAELHGR